MTCSISLTSLYLSPTSPDWRMIVDFDLIPVSPCKQTSFFFFFFFPMMFLWLRGKQKMAATLNYNDQGLFLILPPALDDL